MEVKTRNRAELKSYFVKNSIPTESNFAELIDGILNQKDDGLVKLANTPLSIEAVGDDASTKDAINLYRKIDDEKPDWTINLNPRSDPNKPETAKPGFNISDGEGNNRLFIDRASGHVGVGTTEPLYKLHIIAPGGFSGENADGTSKPGNVPLIAQSNSTAIGIINGSGRQAFALNINGDNGTPDTRGVPTFYDKYDGSWRNSISLKNGNVGIGTTDPKERLQIGGDKGARFHDGGHKYLTWNAYWDSAQWKYGGNDSAVLLGVDYNRDRFLIKTAPPGTKGQSITWKNGLVIDKDGNVGIGTTNPGAKLDVSGSGANQCCAPVPPTISLAEASNTVGRQAWLQFHNAGEAEAYIRLAGGGPAGSGREGQRRLEIGDNQAVKTSLVVEGNIGIGTTDPGDALQINKNWFDSNTNDWGGGLRLTSNAPTISFWETDHGKHRWMWHLNQDVMNLYRRPAGGSWQKRVWIDKNGSLEVAGDIDVNGDINVTGRIQQQSWRIPAFQNGWINYSNTYNSAGYFKDSLGIVHLKGLVKNGTIGKAIFTLPAGYRPPKRELHVVCTNPNASGRVDIPTNGQVLAHTGSKAWISLDGITFRAA